MKSPENKLSNEGPIEDEQKEKGTKINIGNIFREVDAGNSYLSELHSDNPMFLVEQGQAGINQSVAEREMELVELNGKLNLELVATGLSIAEDKDLNRLHITISDADRFLSYLDKLSQGNITPSQSEGVKKLFDHLSEWLLYGGNSEAKDIEGVEKFDDDQNNLLVELFRIKDRLEAILKKIDPDRQKGIIGSAQELNSLLEIAKKGYLREYVIAEKHDLLIRPGEKYSHSNDHEAALDPLASGMPNADLDEEDAREIEIENYERIWDDILGYVSVIKKNDKAAGLYREVVGNLSSVLDYAKHDIRSRGFNKSSSKLLEIINENIDALKGVGMDEFSS